MAEYAKILTRPEARHRYWHVHKADRGFFPGTGEAFGVEFDGTVHELKVNHKDDIMTGKLYSRHRFQEGDRIVLTGGAGRYVLDAPDTRPYGE